MMEDLIYRSDAIKLLEQLSACKEYGVEMGTDDETYIGKYEAITVISDITAVEPKQWEWIPCSERLPEHSYTKRFWLTVKLDDNKGTITTLIGTWSAWGGNNNGGKPYDAFDCWKDVMINGGIYRMSQPIPKEQVLAWMPLPEPWRGAEDD